MLSSKKVLEALSSAAVEAQRRRLAAQKKHEAMVKVVRELAVPCSECKKRSPLHLWIFIQNRYYVPPSGCTEGAYWVDSLFQHCHLVCPTCSHRNRIDFRPDMEPLLEIRKMHYFSDTELFDPKIVVESDPQSF